MNKIRLKNTSVPKNEWIRQLQEKRLVSQQEDELILDFSECTFVEPMHVVLLGCFLEEYNQNGTAVLFEFGENYAVKEYLSDIKFSDFWKDGFDKTEYAQSGKSKNLRLWKVEPGRITPYVTHVQNYFEANFLSDKNVGPLYVILSEVFNNIQDHSNSKVSGFTTCQYYPKSDKIKIAVCDFGVGIPTKIKNFLGKSDSDMPDNVALEKAFEKKFSTQSTPQNRGFGLDTLLSIVKTLDGSVKIFSNKAMLTSNGTDFDSRILNHDFRGTIFEIVLNTLKFDEKEEEVSEEGYYFS